MSVHANLMMNNAGMAVMNAGKVVPAVVKAKGIMTWYASKSANVITMTKTAGDDVTSAGKKPILQTMEAVRVTAAGRAAGTTVVGMTAVGVAAGMVNGGEDY